MSLDLRGRPFDPAARRPARYTDSTWGFLLSERPGGRTRLVVSGYWALRPGWLRPILSVALLEPAHWIMQTRQFTNLQRRVRPPSSRWRNHGEITINRPVEAVFDAVADERTEPRYNPRIRNVELLTPEPPGVGTRFRAEGVTSGRATPMTIQYTCYDRPHRLGSTTRMAAMDIDYSLVLEAPRHRHADAVVLRPASARTAAGAPPTLGGNGSPSGTAELGGAGEIPRGDGQRAGPGLSTHRPAPDGRNPSREEGPRWPP
jgi:polyketide cyclase/dehydrase/lipid transport protein